MRLGTLEPGRKRREATDEASREHGVVLDEASSASGAPEGDEELQEGRLVRQ